MGGKHKQVPEIVWAPASAALLSVVIGAIGMLGSIPLLFPSLGPTIFLQVHDPEQKSAQPYNVVAGHAIGIVAAIVGVLLTGAGATPSVLSSNELSWPRVWASVIAMALTLLGQVPLKASHPPAAATALLIALGGFNLEWRSMAVLAGGIIITAGLGEILRRLRSQT